MPLPVTISAVQFPDQNYYCGPFLSGGAFYTVLLDSTDNSLVEVHKATDPTSSFSEQDSANKPNATDDISSMWVFRKGTDLHIAHAENDGGSPGTGRVGYSVFHMATDLWDGTLLDLLVEASLTEVDVLDMSCSIALRSDGDVIVLYNGVTDTIHGSERQRVDYGRKENGTFANVGIAVDDAGADDWFGSVIVPGSGNRMHFFFKNDGVDDAFQRTLLSDNSLETFPSSGDVNTDIPNHIFVPGISYDDGGTQRIRCPYLDGNRQLSYAEFDSVDAPGAFTANININDNDVDVINSYPTACLAVDGTDEHLLYSGGGTAGVNQDLYHDKNDGVDVEILDGVTVNRLSSNVYNRSGKKLAYVYDDGGTIKYNEVDIATGTPVSNTLTGHHEAGAGVTEMVQGHHEASGSPAATLTGHHEALTPLVQTLLGNHEALTEASRTVVGHHEAGGIVAQPVVGHHEALVNVAQTMLGGHESLASVEVVITGHHEGLAEVLRTVLASWEAGQGVVVVSQTVLVSWEAGQGLKVTLVGSHEALAEVLRTVVGHHEAQAEVLRTVVGHHEALAALLQTVIAQHEAEGIVIQLVGPNHEALSKVITVTVNVHEAQAGVVETIAAVHEALGSVIETVQANHEARGSLVATVVAAHEAAAQASATTTGSYEALAELRRTVAANHEALLSVLETVIANWEAETGVVSVAQTLVVSYEALAATLRTTTGGHEASAQASAATTPSHEALAELLQTTVAQHEALTEALRTVVVSWEIGAGFVGSLIMAFDLVVNETPEAFRLAVGSLVAEELVVNENVDIVEEG